MPIFAGTHHHMLNKLTISTLYSRKHIPLGSLDVKSSRKCLLTKLDFKVHISWSTNRRCYGSSIPIDIITGEVMRIPRHVVDYLPQILSSPMCKNFLTKNCSVFNLKTIILEIHNKCVQNIDANSFTENLLYAACSGCFLTEDELKKLKQHQISAISILDASAGDDKKSRIIVMPSLLMRRVDCLPSSFASFLKLDYVDNDKHKNKNNVATSFSTVWKRCNADRIGMIFNLLKFLGKKSFLLKDLFGEKCINLTPNNDIFKVEFILPVDVEQSNRRNFYVDVPVQFLQNKEDGTVANAHAFQILNENTQPWVNIFMKRNVAFIDGVNSHPLADVLLYLQPIATNVNNALVWISIQEPEDELDAQQVAADLFL
jgi:hypothetical protein